MPIPSWPVGLPSTPQRSSFRRLQHHRPLRKTEVEDGPDLLGVQSQTVIKRFQYSISFTSAQYETWRAFADTTLKQGSQQFTMPVLVSSLTVETRRVYLEDGHWADEPFRLGWLVSFVLCVFPTA
jgi:hypothetical protein